MIRFAGLLTALSIFLLHAPVWAAQDEPPFEMPSSKAVDIPDGKGMSYFYDTWSVPGGRGGGPITNTPDSIIHYETRVSNPDWSYRVLYEARNYILTTVLYRFSDGRERTDFTVFYLRQEELLAKRTAEQASLSTASCSEARSSGRDNEMESAAPFHTWSDEKFLEEFSIRCAITIPGT